MGATHIPPTRAKRAPAPCAVLAAALFPLLCAAQQAPSVPAPRLALPLSCTLGRDCWVANYVDVDDTPLARDFRCGPRSYDGHDGVDIAIRDLGVMQDGVPVLAAAAGVVRNVRDGMEDVAIADAASRERIAGRDCGNGVLLEHPGGWQTQYCHLRRGSVQVAPGQAVQAGTPLALVGLSGNTEFPHLHLALRSQGRAVDPFTGQGPGAGCQAGAATLWLPESAMEYEGVALYNAGFAPGPPDIAAVRRGERDDGPFPASSPALVLWVDALGVQPGDRLQFRILGPGGEVLFEAVQPVDRTQARRFVFAGRKRPGAAWPGGTYTGEVSHLRGVAGQESVRRISRELRVE